MKTLLLLRHAKSSHDDSNHRDHERPLNDRGFKEAQKTGQFMKDEKLIPDLIITSSAIRTVQTAEIVKKTCHYKNERIVTDKLYEASVRDYLQITVDFSKKNYNSVMLVGHNPTIEQTLSLLIGQSKTMKTADLAQLELSIDSWRELFEQPVKAQLKKYFSP